MKKILILVCFVFAGNVIFSQKMMTRSGEIKFEASMPAFEEVSANNNSASCIFDEASGDLAALVLIKGFKFKVPLMEEHFNENYMESSQYPKATFKGKILNFDAAKLSTSKAIYDLEGDLTIHGITKKIKTKITLVVNAGKVNITSSFLVRSQDYKIEIPSLVKNKIAESVKVVINFVLEGK